MVVIGTTDNQNEIFTHVDDNDNVIGPISRKEAHEDKNIIHRSVGIFLVNPKREILFQQRSLTKDKDPGYWSYSVSGHVIFNDEYIVTARRELFEELGIKAELKFLTKSVIKMNTETEFTAFLKLNLQPIPT